MNGLLIISILNRWWGTYLKIYTNWQFGNWQKSWYIWIYGKASLHTNSGHYQLRSTIYKFYDSRTERARIVRENVVETLVLRCWRQRIKEIFELFCFFLFFLVLGNAYLVSFGRDGELMRISCSLLCDFIAIECTVIVSSMLMWCCCWRRNHFVWIFTCIGICRRWRIFLFLFQTSLTHSLRAAYVAMGLIP